MSKNSISECVKAAKLLDEVRRSLVKPVPDGWFTVDDYASENGCATTTARLNLNFLLKNNKIKKQEHTDVSESGVSFKKPIYKII